jgi:hypothetical protein
LVALLNSIEANAGRSFPICVIPYDRQLDKVRQLVQARENLMLFEDWEAIAFWEDFVTQIWQAHPKAIPTWQEKGISGIHRMGSHHRLVAFNGPFDHFVYMDADTLLLNSLDIVFEKLEQYDWVTYDFQHKDPTHVFEVSSPKLLQVFDQTRIDSEIFCAGFFGSKRGIFPSEKRDWLLSTLKNGEAEILYFWAVDQPILNYMAMRSQLSIHNLGLHLEKAVRTGNSVTSSHFENRDFILYDRDRRLTYLHYIGVSSKAFNQLCEGQNVDFPYRDIFLHYRYLHEPEKRPVFSGKPVPYEKPYPSLTDRILRKLKLVH